MNLYREKPSSKAREYSYIQLRKLMLVLYNLDVSKYFYEVDTHSMLLGWKHWVNQYTPPDKRGYTGDPKKDKLLRRLNEQHKTKNT
jgi:hypothetical protein